MIDLSKFNTPVSIVLTTDNRLKQEALQRFLIERRIEAEVESLPETSTGFSGPYVGELATFKASANRIFMALDAQPNADIYVSIDRGIERNDSDQWCDFSLVSTFVPKHKIQLYEVSTLVYQVLIYGQSRRDAMIKQCLDALFI